MFEKILGKKKSIQRSLILNFVIAIIITLVLSILGFYLFVNNQTVEKLIEVNVSTEEDIKEVLTVLRRTIAIIVVNTLLISIFIIGITSKKMLGPLKKVTEATKKVAAGDFKVKLETQREDEIGELTNNFNKMVTELSSIETLKKEFIDSVSHEIKTPISSIKGFAQLLKDEKTSNKEKEEYVDIIIEETDRLLNLSTNMLKLSKLQNQTRITNKEPIDIAEQIRKAIILLEQKWKEKGIKFNISLEEKYFYGDEELTYQIWVNLIDNAIKFSNKNGIIDITLKEKDNFLEFKIKDNGIGMDEEEKENIFKRFYQVDKSHSEQGSGLGLSIVKRIVELSNGNIDVESKINKGTTITVKLPIEKETNKILIV